MPDIWTKHPEIVKALLEEGGFTCGVEPRVLKPRDPNWTCIIDGEKISGDLYLHPVSELAPEKLQMGMSTSLFLFFIFLLLALFARRSRGRAHFGT